WNIASAGYVRQFSALFTTSPTAECVTCPAVVTDYSHCVIDKRSCGTLADESASVGVHFWSQRSTFTDVAGRFRALVSRQCYRLSAGSGAINHLPVKFRC